MLRHSGVSLLIRFRVYQYLRTVCNVSRHFFMNNTHNLIERIVITFPNEISPKHKLIVIEYWTLLKAGKFEFELEVIEKKYGLEKGTAPKWVIKQGTIISSIIKCIECKINTSQIKITSRYMYKKTLLPPTRNFLCTDCEAELANKNKMILEDRIKYEEEKKLYPITNKNWNRLSIPAMNLLIRILRVKSRHLIFKSIYDNNYIIFRNDSYLKELEELDLLEIDWDYRVNYPPKFEWRTELEEALAKEIEYYENEDNYDNENNYEMKEAPQDDHTVILNLHLRKNSNQFLKATNPPYSQMLTLDTNFLLKAGTKYMIGMWEWENGYKVKLQPAKNF